MQLPLKLITDYNEGQCSYDAVYNICKWLRDEKNINIYATMKGQNYYLGVIEELTESPKRKWPIVNKRTCADAIKATTAEEAIITAINIIIEEY